MRILMRNTIFKTVALAGLFLCLLALAVVFSGTTDLVHATHGETPAITADQVVTEADLELFVKEAADAYYVDFIMKHECDFSSIESLVVPGIGEVAGTTIDSILPDTDTATIKDLIPAFANLDIGDYCNFSQPFHEVFGRGDGDWKSGSIYLFIMNDEGEMLYHGAELSVEGTTVDAVDEGGRDVLEVITDEIETPSTSNPGIVQYCWDDPTVTGDNNRDEEGNRIAGEAPGNSWKISYVVDPFEYLEINPPMDSPSVIFGSGIYPKTGTPLSGCDIVTDPEPTDPEPTDPEPTDPEPTDPGMVTSVSGGGCAIATGSDGAPKSNAFNLLLIVSALLFTVSFGNRAMGRRNRISS